MIRAHLYDFILGVWFDICVLNFRMEYLICESQVLILGPHPVIGEQVCFLE
jgi:hypothetical protein